VTPPRRPPARSQLRGDHDRVPPPARHRSPAAPGRRLHRRRTAGTPFPAFALPTIDDELDGTCTASSTQSRTAGRRSQMPPMWVFGRVAAVFRRSARRMARTSWQATAPLTAGVSRTSVDVEALEDIRRHGSVRQVRHDVHHPRLRGPRPRVGDAQDRHRSVRPDHRAERCGDGADGHTRSPAGGTRGAVQAPIPTPACSRGARAEPCRGR
jgi:hypothetical protein